MGHVCFVCVMMYLSTFFCVIAVTHVSAHDVLVDLMREFYDNATLVLQIHIVRKDKHSYSHQDI